jgi:hypothetical protein
MGVLNALRLMKKNDLNRVEKILWRIPFYTVVAVDQNTPGWNNPRTRSVLWCGLLYSPHRTKFKEFFSNSAKDNKLGKQWIKGIGVGR